MAVLQTNVARDTQVEILAGEAGDKLLLGPFWRKKKICQQATQVSNIYRETYPEYKSCRYA